VIRVGDLCFEFHGASS